MKRSKWYQLLVGSALSSFLLSLLLVLPVAANPPVPEESLTLQELIDLPESDLANVDIAAVNLACADGLPGSENIDRKALLAKLDVWARRVAAVTASKAHFFKSNPDYYENSWAKFCSIMLVLTLQQDLGVHYNFEQRTNPSLAKWKDQFIHGIVEGTGGTCASLPVVFMAVGRRLGYPLKLVQGLSHFYARWDDPNTGEVFNLEGSYPEGVDFPSDELYKEWPHPLTDTQLEHGNFLKSLSPLEELSSFIAARGDCLRENGRWTEALGTYQQSVELAPQNLFVAGLLRETVKIVRRMQAAQRAEAIYQQHERRRRTDPRLMIPGMPSVPTAFAVNTRRPGNGMPTSLQQFPHPTGPGVPRSLIHTSMDGTEFQPPSMQDYLNETNRQNQQLMRFGRQKAHRPIHGPFPIPSRPRTPNYGRKP